MRLVSRRCDLTKTFHPRQSPRRRLLHFNISPSPQYNVFLFTILGFFLLAAIYFAIFPSDRKHLNEVMQKIKKEKAKERKDFGSRLAQTGGALSLV